MEELPHAVAHVMEAMKEAIAKTSKVGRCEDLRHGTYTLLISILGIS